MEAKVCLHVLLTALAEGLRALIKDTPEEKLVMPVLGVVNFVLTGSDGEKIEGVMDLEVAAGSLPVGFRCTNGNGSHPA